MKKIILAALVLVASGGSALAVDFASPMNMIDGKTPMRNEDKSIVTLGEVSENALLATFPDEQSLAGEEKMKRFALARKIHEQRKDPVLTAEDIALLKKLIGKAYNALVVGQAYGLLDPASVAK